MRERRRDSDTRDSVREINAYIQQSTGKRAVRIEGKFKFIPQESRDRPPANRPESSK